MKKINLNLDYGLKGEEKKRAKQLTLGYLEGAVNLAFQGLEGQKRRMWGRIQRKMDAVREDKKNNILELEDTEFDFVYDAFDRAKFPPSLAKFLNDLEDHLDDVKKGREKE